MIHPERIFAIRQAEYKQGPVVYWMSRDQRATDNWALLFVQQQALKHKAPLLVVFCLVPDFLQATLRQYAFMLKGLDETSGDLRNKNIPFILLNGRPGKVLPDFIREVGAGALVTDFDPLKIKRKWKKAVNRGLDIPFFEVDAHNIVPCRMASPKQEFGAYTIRPKIQRLLPDYLADFPALQKHPVSFKKKTKSFSLPTVLEKLKLDRSVEEVSGYVPGPAAGRKALKDFLKKKINAYPAGRNDPNLDGQSGLSPYLHFGQIAPQRVALETVKAKGVKPEAREDFLEEMVMRRELSDNFCFYNPHYDSVLGFPDWARRTLNTHHRDKREYRYTLKQFEAARTHDPLWNAAQKEMVARGKMHGYMRMYWAKKILEWSPSPGQAHKIAVYLNDKYELDGRDPNGYTGIAWSIGGVHDRAWGERAIFGKIRYMSYNGCRSKFEVERYIHAMNNLPTKNY